MINIAQIPVHIQNIARGDLGIDQTVNKMRQMILASLGKQEVRIAAEEIIGHVAPNDRKGEARAVYEFVRDKVRYTKDPNGMEYVQTPNHILGVIRDRGQAYGDCDDKVVLGLSLLKNLGYPVAIRVASYQNHRHFTHVYGMVKVYDEWMPFDATPSNQELGWELEPRTRVKDYQLGEYGWDMGELGEEDGINVYGILNTGLGILLGSLLAGYVLKKEFGGGAE